ncbi:MAG: ABC transporter ATP-binding protein [Clostridiales bacterium]|nr:ABC transporter ATP-binding protein [Clostridiales bacterium]
MQTELQAEPRGGSLLEIKNLSVEFQTDQGTVHALRGVSMDVAPGEILGIVGESGSGKSVAMCAVMGLLADNGRVTGGSVAFGGREIGRPAFASDREHERFMMKIRGNAISMIFQDPMTFLNPVLTIEKQLAEPILNHTPMPRAAARARAIELMRQVGIPSPERRIRQCPHEFSGGMRQRIIIAIAIANRPRLIIADEPTTALDVTIQAQILDLIRDMARESGSSTILITHDLSVVSSMCDRVNVMYGGKIVETGTDREIYYSPAHPYTQGLLMCANDPDDCGRELRPIPGSPPDLLKAPAGCPFADRCESAMKICKLRMPESASLSGTHSVACWLGELARRRGAGKGAGMGMGAAASMPGSNGADARASVGAGTGNGADARPSNGAGVGEVAEAGASMGVSGAAGNRAGDGPAMAAGEGGGGRCG